MEKSTPKKLSERYEDLGPLGRGGMGEVRRVFDQLLGRTVAMKLIHVDRINDDLLGRFIEEAQVSARLQHPNLLPIHDLGKLPNGRFYFTMKIAEGESLHHRIKALHKNSIGHNWAPEGQPYSLRRLLTAFKSVCDAVAYAHSRSVLHRDIKPQNIIIGHHGAVQLIDWGIAQRLENYYKEWATEVVDHYQVTLTPVEKLLDSSKPSSPTDELLISDQVSSNQNLSETIDIDQELLETLVSLETYEKLNSLEIADTISPLPHRIPERDELTKFSVSSGELISMSVLHHSQRTSHDTIAGTLDYMAPEQLMGDIQQISYQTDVYGLGVVLYEILTGSVPFKLDASFKTKPLMEKMNAALLQRKKRVQWPINGPTIPQELKDIVECSLQEESAKRYKSSGFFAIDLVKYLDGVGRREKGLEKVDEALVYLDQARDLNKKSVREKSEGEKLLKTLKAEDPEAVKVPVWQHLDQVQALEAEVQQLQYLAQRTLHDALLFDASLGEAHTELAMIAREAHHQAELKSKSFEAKKQESIIKDHLPFVKVEKANQLKRYLAPQAPLSLKFAVPKDTPIEVSAQPYQVHNRRLILGERTVWSNTYELHQEVSLGTYLLTIKAEGYDELKYPIVIERERGWSSTPPGQSLVKPIPLIPEGKTPTAFHYVPEGWFYTGGDPLVSNNVEHKRRLWLDGFLMAEKHVTHREYLLFIQDLYRSGHKETAYRLRPRLRDEEGEGIYRFEAGFVRCMENDFVNLDWPANYTDYESALSYSQWYAEKQKRPYRMPADMEWEKVARNVDGRSFPWGEHFDPSFAHMRLSQATPSPSTPYKWTADLSSWGQYALSGSMRDWTCTVFKSPFPYQADTRVVLPSKAEQQDLEQDRVVRGGSWKTQEGNCRVAFRFVATPKYRDDDGSFRLALSLDGLLT